MTLGPARQSRRPSGLRLAVLIPALALNGCNLVFPYQSHAPDGQRSRDRGFDRAIFELSSADRPSSDSARRDQSAGEVLRRDAQLDRPRADLPRPDAAKPKPDLPKVDLPAIPDLPKQDAGGAVGCAAGAVRIAFEPASGMDPAFAYCSQSTPVNQCTAQLLCASGWQLCPALTYQKKHGASTPPPTAIQAWIAGHVRNNGTPYAPQDGLVLCTLLKTTWADTSWFCNGTANDQQQQAYVGLSTYAQCRRVGTSTAATEAHWQTFAAVDGNNVKAAVCCK